MPPSNTILNTRRFIVKGHLECDFTPDSTSLIAKIQNLEIELWQKSPLDVFFLGKGYTNDNAEFVISFEVNDETSFLSDGIIENVFAKVRYKGNVISGENPYINEESSNNRPIKEITLREGLTDIGGYRIKITEFEYTSGNGIIEIAEKPAKSVNSILFDIKSDSTNLPLPIGYRCTYRGYIKGRFVEISLFTIVSNSVKEGYSELIFPEIPAVVKQLGNDIILNLTLHGIPESPSNDCYLRLDDGIGGYYYSLITDIIINDGKLSIFSEDVFYTITGMSSDMSDTTVVIVSEIGQVVSYDANLDQWDETFGFKFYQIQYPENLEEVSSGIYRTTGTTGTITSGTLGTGTFEGFTISVVNIGIFPININLRIEAPSKETIFFNNIEDILPGSMDFILIVTDDFPTEADNSPDFEDIEVVSGIEFSTALKSFLTGEDLNTINQIKKAGPIKYINGLPTLGISDIEINVLQTHVDLYGINSDLAQNQYLLEIGFDNLYKIAETPKDIFLSAIEDPDFPLYLAAQIHETIVQNQKLITNLLSAKLTDYELKTPFIPDLPNSTFANTAFSKFINRCECEDCTSAVSPFSYMVDLLKYGAKHIKKTGSPSYSPVNYNAFLTLLENYFFQPFGSFAVDCNTLHHEYCRMRLVTEILEQLVATKTLPIAVIERLENDRKIFILLTYKTLLTQAGTSYEELRNVISIQDSEEKEIAAQQLSDKLGILLFVPGENTLTIDRMWLTYDNFDEDQELNAENLEVIFGFRDTQRDVLTNPPASLISQWKESYLFDLWKSTDYLFSAYSREDVDSTDDGTFKSDWKPIIDPDSFGRGDMTYESSEFALELWRHRKSDTDSFLSYFVNDNNILSRTSADILARILRIPGKNLNGVQFQNNKISIQNPSTSVFVEFEIYNTALNGVNTDIILKKSTPEVTQEEMFQPEGINPVMRYNSVLNVIDPVIDTSYVNILWESPVILNYLDILSGGIVTLISSGAPLEIYTTEDSSIDNVTITVDLDGIELTLNTTPSSEFVAGNLTLIYTAEVALDTTTIPDPEKICDELFTINNFEYSYLSPAPSGMTDPFVYTVWDTPSTWPGNIGAEPTFFKKLKKLYEILRSGTTVSDYLDIVTGNLHTDMYGFNLLMESLISCEQFLNSMYTHEKPETEKLYNTASVFRNSARQLLDSNWVKEEIKYVPSEETEPEKLMLNARYFWNSLNEPLIGSWDSTLQTIPDLVLNITDSNIPIIDPELVRRTQILVSPDADIYRDLYEVRFQQLETQRSNYFSWIASYDIDGFEHILNHINTGDENSNYDIFPYSNMDELIQDFESNDVFKQLKATQVLDEAFKLSADVFSSILPIMLAYEDVNPTNQPTIAELRLATDLFVTACKKKRFYFTIGIETGWIEEEVEGSFPDGIPVKYYNVLEMRLDSIRGSVLNRSEWKQTLAKWNRVPTIFPDIVPPENIINFIDGEVVHDIWIGRKAFLDTIFNEIHGFFNETIPVATLFEHYQGILSKIVARSESIPDYGYYVYITSLFEKEDAGEDIRPNLNQLNIQVAEYRFLRQTYEVLESGAVPLLTSEYDDVNNIAIHITIMNSRYFEWVNKEYGSNIVLTGNDFQNYSPSIINFPINLVEETIQWRSPNKDKKYWKDTLNSRIERKQSVFDEWETVLEETEDITMRVMRDALIQALRNNCESLDDAAERLAKTLFIETKDNCCVKHSRVSHAIETIQGLIFSLESGIYDNYLNGFTLIAPSFDEEWQWLGSYATWRSAVFAYIYPENLLYPTLKRRQSPAFIELAETIQNANRFTPLNACQAAKKYQNYFEDIQNLKIVCTANSDAYVYRKNPLDCCGDLNNSIQEYMTFYFAKSRLSKKAYYSEKPYYSSDSNEHDFWREIPLRENVNIIGCLPLNREYDDNYQGIDRALWLFYTYKEDGEFKLAYLKKDLMTAGSEWTEEEEIELPDLTGLLYLVTLSDLLEPFNPYNNNSAPIGDTITRVSDKLINITVCQNSSEWDFIYFVFTYQRLDGTKKHVHIRYLAQDDFFDKTIGSILVFYNNSLPITAIKHQVPSNFQYSNNAIGITLVFGSEMQTGIYGSLFFNNVSILPVKMEIINLIGAFKKNDTDEVFIIANKGLLGQTEFTEYSFTYSIASGHIVLSNETQGLVVSSFDKNILSVAPRFNASMRESSNAVNVYTTNTLAGVTFIYDVNALSSGVIFSLAPEKTIENIPIVSGECIDQYDLRITNIKKHLRDNINAPLGNPIGSFYRTNTVKEVLYEAYYFVPMLIALDQQQRGDYPTALDWYRSVYDYTNNIASKRKIFYGLVLEQSITNVFDRPEDWLLDPLNPHLVAETRTNAYTKYTLMNIIQCMLSYGDREFTIDTIETVPNARKLYSEALSLMKVSELNVKPSQCYTSSHNCFETAVTSNIEEYWKNSFYELQSRLERLNDVELIESASEELVTIMNGEEATMQEKFTSAFTYLSEYVVPHSSETVSELMDGIGDRMNDAYRYLFAKLDTQSFNSNVGAKFTNTLAKLTSLIPIQVSDAEYEEKISWLKEAVPDNAQSFIFKFLDDDGKQLLSKKDVSFNPLHPTSVAFQTNLVFSNASVLYESFLHKEGFTPFVDYAFCLPSNPVYSALELKANLELFKIHNCRNIAGMERSLDIFAAPTDSTTGVPVIGAGGNLILPGSGSLIPSQYRFRVLIERAKQLVAQAQQLESQFLATLEKEDAENYSQLRARQDLQTAKSTVKLQDLRVKQAVNEEGIADLQLQKMEFVQNTYNEWIDGGLNGYETSSIALLTASAISQSVAAILAFSSPEVIKDFGSGGTSLIASSLGTVSSIMSQLASYQRRSQEWQYQSDLASYDISLANQQIKIAEQNTRIVSQEREIASLNMGHATDTLEFLKTKFTNAELYRWMGNVLERTYSYMLNVSTAVAKTAEQQYYFEQQEQAGPFILSDYWEVPQAGGASLSGGGVDRRGLTGSVRLLQDITKLDQYAFETTKRKLQMTKVISLGQNFPDAFQSFRETGVFNFDLTDRLFDYDFPGHYLRLVNGIKVSLIGLVPVYDSIKATLTAGTTSYTVISANNSFQRIPIRRMEVEQVALTGASRATGLFEFQQAQGELLNPFEGMGIESRWEFKMPRFSNRMDYSNIADVLIEVEYTALDSFQYRYQVLQDIDNTLGFSRGFSFKNDYPDQWYELAQAQAGGSEFFVEIELKRDQFPQGIENIRLDGSNLLLHFVRKDEFTDEVNIADFGLVSNAANAQPMNGITVNGTFSANALTNVLSTQTPASPFVKLRLAFANTVLNREMFSNENVTDVLLLVNCKADLPVYPL